MQLNFQHIISFLNFRNNLLMLYKNLPAIPFASVFLVRFFMDYVAALQMLCAGKWKNAWAVAQARWAYWQLKSQYREIRKQNIRLAVQPYPSTICRRSIIFDFYIRGKRK